MFDVRALDAGRKCCLGLATIVWLLLSNSPLPVAHDWARVAPRHRAKFCTFADNCEQMSTKTQNRDNFDLLPQFASSSLRLLDLILQAANKRVKQTEAHKS